MGGKPSIEEALAAKLTEAVTARAGMTVAADLATAVFARTHFQRSSDLKKEMLDLYLFFRGEVDRKAGD